MKRVRAGVAHVILGKVGVMDLNLTLWGGEMSS